MIDQLPEGKSIGWMQAPPQWIFTHTVRFVGVVRVVIQDGEGFILIKKGKPLVYFFKHGRIELRGHAALDYFNSHPTIEFNLCKYTPEEFAQALKICNVEDILTEPVPAVQGPAEPAAKPAEIPQQPPEVSPAMQEEVIAPEQQGQEVHEVPDLTQQVPAVSPVPEKPPARMVEQVPAQAQEKPIVPQPVVLDDPDIKIIGQIKKLNGIVAISVFNDDRNILLMGDVEIEPLLKIARTMLATTNKITPLLDWGSFVHMTLQIPEGNVIIAPYHENHLCILTTRTINIGHIRRILRDLQQDRHAAVML
jgi:hypothetical protein